MHRTRTCTELHNNWITISILLLGGIPLIAGGYLYYLWFLLFYTVIKLRYIPKDSIYILVFSFFYTYTQILYAQITLSAIIFYISYPFILYCTGVYLGKRLQSYKAKILLIVLIAGSFGITSIYYNIIDFMKGDFINLSRAVLYGEENSFRSATGYAMMLSLLVGGIGCIFVNTTNDFDRRLKIIIVGLAGLALFLNIRLLNRTPLAIGMISIATAVLMPPQNKKKVRYTISIIALLLIVYYFVVANNDNISSAIDLFQSRNEDETSSASSAGGRDEKWIGAIHQILHMPFGSNGLVLDGTHTYAHNLWLDSGVKGGIICLVCLTIITIKLIGVNIRLFKVAPYPQFEKVYFVLIGISLLTQSAVEPIIEGFPQLFNFLLFYWGFLSTDYKRITRRQ